MLENLLTNPLWQVEYFNNTLLDYLIFFLVFVLLSGVIFGFKLLLFRKISRRFGDKKVVGLLTDIVGAFRSSFYIFLSFYLSLFLIEVPEILKILAGILLILWAAQHIALIIGKIVDFGKEAYREKTQEKNDAMLRTVALIVKIILWSFILLAVLSVFGVNITGIVAGMGIGGVAVAFALQNILSDLFSSFSIYFDKPFLEGDLIVVGGKWGTVERIGIKSTRLRSLQGEEIVFSNKELTSAQVHNYRKMEKRRAEFTLGVVYETPTEKMEKIPEIVKEIVEKEEMAEFTRIHFFNFGDFSLDYHLIYHIKSPDYMVFMDVNEKILLEIKRAFEKEGIEFAYPTKTIHLTGNSVK